MLCLLGPITLLTSENCLSITIFLLSPRRTQLNRLCSLKEIQNNILTISCSEMESEYLEHNKNYIAEKKKSHFFIMTITEIKCKKTNYIESRRITKAINPW